MFFPLFSPQVLGLVFDQFHLEAHSNCNFDSLDIRDGNSESATRIGRFCGTSLPNGGTINSTSNSIYLRFRSDYSIAGDGFRVHWTSHLPGEHHVLSIPVTEQLITGSYYDYVEKNCLEEEDERALN